MKLSENESMTECFCCLSSNRDKNPLVVIYVAWLLEGGWVRCSVSALPTIVHRLDVHLLLAHATVTSGKGALNHTTKLLRTKTAASVSRTEAPPRDPLLKGARATTCTRCTTTTRLTTWRVTPWVSVML